MQSSRYTLVWNVELLLRHRLLAARLIRFSCIESFVRLLYLFQYQSGFFSPFFITIVVVAYY